MLAGGCHIEMCICFIAHVYWLLRTGGYRSSKHIICTTGRNELTSLESSEICAPHALLTPKSNTSTTKERLWLRIPMLLLRSQNCAIWDLRIDRPFPVRSHARHQTAILQHQSPAPGSHVSRVDLQVTDTLAGLEKVCLQTRVALGMDGRVVARGSAWAGGLQLYWRPARLQPGSEPALRPAHFQRTSRPRSFLSRVLPRAEELTRCASIDL